MNFKKTIKKILSLKIPSIRSKNTQDYWKYRLSVREVSLIFDANYRKCFKFPKRKGLNSFLNEYNRIFNQSSLKQLNSNVFRLRLYNKHLKLRAMYNSLLNIQGKNAKAEFKKMFGFDYENTDHLEYITKEDKRIVDKMNLVAPAQKKDTITFNKLIALVESSSGRDIDRNIKLFEFEEIYNIELKKWQAT